MSEMSDKTKKNLLKNKHIVCIKSKHIQFTPGFKEHAVRENLLGKSPDEIFRESGFEIEWFPENYCRYCLKRWRKKFNEEGPQALYTNNTGKNSSGRPKNPNKDDLTLEELRFLVKAQREVIEMLKKNRALLKEKK